MHPTFVVDWSTIIWSVTCAFAAVFVGAGAALWSVRNLDVVNALALE